MRRTTRGLIGAAFAAGLALTGCGTDEETPELVVPTEEVETPPRLENDDAEDTEG